MGGWDKSYPDPTMVTFGMDTVSGPLPSFFSPVNSFECRKQQRPQGTIRQLFLSGMTEPIYIGIASYLMRDLACGIPESKNAYIKELKSIIWSPSSSSWCGMCVVYFS